MLIDIVLVMDDVGPLSLTNKDDWDKVGRVSKSPNASEIETNQYMKWLSSWPQSSVIYVGSFCPVEPKVLIEIGLGNSTKRWLAELKETSTSNTSFFKYCEKEKTNPLTTSSFKDYEKDKTDPLTTSFFKVCQTCTTNP